MLLRKSVPIAMGIFMVVAVAACGTPTATPSGQSPSGLSVQVPFDPATVGTDSTVTGAREVASKWVQLVGANRSDEACRLLTQDADVPLHDNANGNTCVSHMTQTTSAKEVRQLWLTSTIPQVDLNGDNVLYVYRTDMLDASGHKWLQDKSFGSFASIKIEWVAATNRWQITRLSAKA